jgi:mRNA interferase MazF
VRRGDVVVVADRAGGDHAGKPRPSVIIQADAYAETLSVVVCPLTSDDRLSPLLRVRLEPSASLPLATPSWIMVDKPTSLRRDRVRQVIGRVPAEAMLEVDRALASFLGIA